MDVLQTLKSEPDRAQKEPSKLNAAIKAVGGRSGRSRQSLHLFATILGSLSATPADVGPELPRKHDWFGIGIGKQ